MRRFILTLSVFCASAYGVIDVTKAPYNVRSDQPTLDQTEAIAKAIQIAINRGEQVYFPGGTYLVSRTIANVGPRKALVMRGEGLKNTTIKLNAPLGDRGLIEAVGGKVPNTKSDDEHAAQLDIRDLTFDAMAGDYHLPGHKADAIRLSYVVLSKFESVMIKHFDGAAIRGVMFWDSVFNDVHFVRSGSATRQVPAVVLRSRGNDDYHGATNNIYFTNCRWESNFYVSLRLAEGARKMHLSSNKFHGLLPTATPFDHLQMFDSNSNTIIGNNFTHGGANSLTIKNSYGNSVSGNTIGGQPGYAVDIEKSPRNSFTGNVINIENSNSGVGDVRWFENTGSQFTGNVTRRKCQLEEEVMVCQ